MVAALHHLVDCLSASWTSTVASMGTTTLALFLLAVVPFCASLGWHLYREGFVSMKEHTRRNLLGGVRWALVIWSAIYGWNVIKTIYNDHEQLVVQSDFIRHQARLELDRRNTEIAVLQKKCMSPVVDLSAHYSSFIGFPVSVPPHSTIYVLMLDPKDSGWRGIDTGFYTYTNGTNKPQNWPNKSQFLRDPRMAGVVGCQCEIQNFAGKPIMHASMPVRIKWYSEKTSGQSTQSTGSIVSAQMRTISLGPIKDGDTFSFYVINKSPTLSAYFDYPLIAMISIAGLVGEPL